MENFRAKEIARIRALVGPNDQVLGGVSGGVDSSVGKRVTYPNHSESILGR